MTTTIQQGVSPSPVLIWLSVTSVQSWVMAQVRLHHDNNPDNHFVGIRDQFDYDLNQLSAHIIITVL